MTAPNRFRTLVAFMAVIVTVLALHRLGTGPLALPRQWSSPALADWAQDRDPITIALVVFRLLVLAVAYHLAITTAIGIAGRIMHLPSWVAAADAWTLPPLRSTWGRVAGLGLTATAALTSQLPAATAASRPTATVQIVEANSSSRSSGTATLRMVDPEPSSGTATMKLVDGVENHPPPDPTLEESVTETVHAPLEATAHVVQPGDHLWAIAEVQIKDHLGRTPTDAEIVPYWQQMIAANPDVADPDLIYPGQAIDVPSVPNN